MPALTARTFAIPLAILRWSAVVVLVVGTLLCLNDLRLPRDEPPMVRIWELAEIFALYGVTMWVLISSSLIGMYGIATLSSRFFAWVHRDV